MAQKKHEIITLIMKTMFQAEERRIQNWTDRLCRANQEFHKKCQMFFWNGRFFRMSNVVGNIPQDKRAPLHSSLCDEADHLIADTKQPDDDKAFMKQAIFVLLEPCETTQDIRDALPEYLVDLVRWETSLPRTREAGYTIQNNPRALRDYHKMLPKIQIYSTARLIY
jgi:hypothetical protein